MLKDKKSPGKPKEFIKPFDAHVQFETSRIKEIDESIDGKRSVFIRKAVDYYFENYDRIMKEKREEKNYEKWTEEDSKKLLMWVRLNMNLTYINKEIYEEIKKYLDMCNEYKNEHAKKAILIKTIEILKTHKIINENISIYDKLKKEFPEVLYFLDKINKIIQKNTP